MDCHEIQRNIPFLNDGTLNTNDEQGLHEHIVHCTNCRAAYEAQKRMLTMVHTAYSPDSIELPSVDMLAAVRSGIERRKKRMTARRYIYATAAAVLIAVTGFMGAMVNRSVIPQPEEVAETEGFYEYVADLYVTSYDLLANVGSLITYDSDEIDPEAVLESGYVSVSVEDMISYLDADELGNVLAQTSY